ncbi:TIGR03899 family protein [uncultured Ferrimonas sp.]|uniref:TIGR03899 family protein n=1 Tax=uncultured Ferrimonas sp. TaxID=432640 RepID=UPI002621C4E3|nr:TIGR03899 family protein [uncultured Ferrimonas sp.]
MNQLVNSEAPKSSSSSNSTRSSVMLLSRDLGLGKDSGGVQERIKQRQSRLAEQYQLNVEAVLKHAISDSQNDIASHELDPDWWHQYQQLAEQIHNPKMQQLWGKILTIELAQPRSFGLKALETLKRMNHRDAQLLLSAVALCCSLDHDPSPIIITGWRSDPALAGLLPGRGEQLSLSGFGLPYSAVLSLRELGILHAVELETGRLPTTTMTLKFFNSRLQLQPKHGRLHLRYLRFTNSGQELVRLLQEESLRDYIASLATLAPKDASWA